MKVAKDLTKKEWLLGILLLTYLGGFSYYWGATTNDLYLIVVFAFASTQFIGNRIILNFIFANGYVYRINNRYLRLLMNFGVNYLIASILMFLVRWVHPGNLDEFLTGPVMFGVMYGILYISYLVMSLKLTDIKNEGSLLGR